MTCSSPNTSAKSSNLVPVAVPLMALLATLFLVRPVGDFPLNDDWVYTQVVQASAAAGRLTATGAEWAWGLPQVIAGVLLHVFGATSHFALRLLTIVCFALSVFVLDAYFRTLSLSPFQRFVGNSALIFFAPAFLAAPTFMTDVPFLLLWMSACFCIDRALYERSAAWMLLAGPLVILALAQRQLGLLIVLPLPFLVMRYRRSLPLALLPSAFLVIALAGIAMVTLSNFWGKAGGASPVSVFDVFRFQRRAANIDATLLVLGLAVIPLLLLRPRPLHAVRRRPRLAIAVGLTVGAITLVRFAFDPNTPFFGNQVSPFGLFQDGEILVGDRPAIFGDIFRFCLSILGSCAASVVIVNLVDASIEIATSKERRYPMGLLLISASGIYLVLLLGRGQLFDRYLIPVVPAALVFCAWYVKEGVRVSKWRKGIATAYVAASALFSTVLAHDYFRWNEARWLAAKDAVASGVAPLDIGAGYEWLNWHRPPHNFFRASDSMRRPYVVTFSPLTGFQEIGRYPWNSWWPPGKREILLVRRLPESEKFDLAPGTAIQGNAS